MSNRLSVVMIAKNAADLLPDCLGSVSWADEIIVLDSGSTDNTVELARRLGAQVYTHTDWRGYGIQRQRAQDYATGDWVLMIDTDERVTPELRQAILKVLDAPQRGAIYSIARRNYFLGRFMRPRATISAPGIITPQPLPNARCSMVSPLTTIMITNII